MMKYCASLTKTYIDEFLIIHLQGWGKTVVLGVDKPGSNLTLSSGEVLRSGKTLTGCLFGSLKPKSDVPMLVKRYLDKVFGYLSDLTIQGCYVYWNLILLIRTDHF